jgi:hypothetical protein
MEVPVVEEIDSGFKSGVAETELLRSSAPTNKRK